MFFDDLVQVFHRSHGGFEQLIRENLRVLGSGRAFPEFHFELAHVLWAHLPLVEHLHRKFTGLGAERIAHFRRAFF